MISSTKGLDSLLASVIRENREKVAGWMKDEPGSWGFLAGKAVRTCRDHKGEPLTDLERRIVWQRLWQILSELKEQAERK